MKPLFLLDKKDYDPSWPRFQRPSVRAIILRGNRVAMVHSLKYDYYKFPGGGVEAGESHKEALIREVLEETGLRVILSSITEFGSVLRLRRDGNGAEEIFEQENFYYCCEAEETADSQKLDDYEAEERFTLEFVFPESAVATNRGKEHNSVDREMLERDSRVLELLTERRADCVRIRPMTLEDYDSVYGLWTRTPGMGLNTTDDSREGIGRYLKRNPGTCFVAEAGETVVGAILAGHDGRRGFINHTAVCPEYRNRGIGSRLVEAATEALEREGIQKAALVVFSRNEAGNAFWEKIGFTERNDLVYRNRNIHPLERMDT